MATTAHLIFFSRRPHGFLLPAIDEMPINIAHLRAYVKIR